MESIKFGEGPIPEPRRKYPDEYSEEEIKERKEEIASQPGKPFKFGQDPIPRPSRIYPDDYTEEEIKQRREEADRQYAKRFEPFPQPRAEEAEDALQEVRGKLAEAPDPSTGPESLEQDA